MIVLGAAQYFFFHFVWNFTKIPSYKTSAEYYKINI